MICGIPFDRFQTRLFDSIYILVKSVAMISLDRVGLSAKTLEKLQKNGLANVSQVYQSSTLTLMSRADMNLSEIIEMNSIISNKLAPKVHTALELYYFDDNLQSGNGSSSNLLLLSTGSKTVNEILEGGFDYRSITELVGPPGIGKTQFCFGCCVDAVLSPHGNSVIFIDTELKFDPLRLSNLIEHRLSLMQNDKNSAIKADALPNLELLLDRIKVKRPKTCKELLEEIDNLETMVISEKVSLIVLDSVAALARKENLNEIGKEEYVIRQSALLKRVAELCNCCVLVTNQILTTSGMDSGVSASVSAVTLFNDAIHDVSGRVFRPALGPTWYHCVGTRIVLEKQARSLSSTTILSSSSSYQQQQPQQLQEDISSTSSLMYGFDRIMSVVKSPRLDYVRAVYEIQTHGIAAVKLI